MNATSGISCPEGAVYLSPGVYLPWGPWLKPPLKLRQANHRYMLHRVIRITVMIAHPKTMMLFVVLVVRGFIFVRLFVKVLQHAAGHHHANDHRRTQKLQLGITLSASRHTVA